MRAVVTVTGKDKKGIIAKVSSFLAERGVNVEDISQTLLQEYFAMIMLVDISDIKTELSVWRKSAKSWARKSACPSACSTRRFLTPCTTSERDGHVQSI